MNEKLLDDLSGRPDVLVVRYDELCERPESLAQDVFTFAGLPWHRQTERFLDRSTSFHGAERYYGVFRDAAQAPHRWRQEMSPADQRQVNAILRQTSLVSLCPDPGF